MKRDLFWTSPVVCLGLWAALDSQQHARAQALIDPAPAAQAAEQSGQNVNGPGAARTERRSILRRNRGAADQPAAIASEAPAYEGGAVASQPTPTSPSASSARSSDPLARPTAPSYPEQPATYNQPNAKPYLGVTFEQRFSNAVVVRAVTPGSPADQAGLRPGDTIHGVNGSAVSSWQDVVNIVGSLRPGDRLDVAFSRRIEDRVQAVLGAKQFDSPQTASYGEPGASAPALGPPQTIPPAAPRNYQDGSASDYSAAPIAPVPAGEPTAPAAAAPAEQGRYFNRDQGQGDERPTRGRGLLRRRN